MAIPHSTDVENAQGFLTPDSLDRIGIKMDVTEFNNYKTGVPDGILGKGSSELFQTLIIMAQLEAGVDKANISTELNEQNLTRVQELLTARGFEEADSKVLIDSLRAISQDQDLNNRYATAASNAGKDMSVDAVIKRRIDESKLSVAATVPEPGASVETTAQNTVPPMLRRPDIEVVDTDDSFAAEANIAPSDQSEIKESGDLPAQNDSQEGIDAKNTVLGGGDGDFTRASINAAADENGVRTIKMTLEEYEDLKDENYLPPSERLRVSAFEATYEQAKIDSGYNTAVDEAKQAREQYGNWQELRQERFNEVCALKNQLDDFSVEVLKDPENPSSGTTSVALDDVVLEIKLPGGDVEYLSKNQVEDKVGWVTWDDKNEAELYDAMEIAYAELQEQSGYNALSKDIDEKTQIAQNTEPMLREELANANRTLRDIEDSLSKEVFSVAIDAPQQDTTSKAMVLALPETENTVASNSSASTLKVGG